MSIKRERGFIIYHNDIELVAIREKTVLVFIGDEGFFELFDSQTCLELLLVHGKFK